jgi:predicted nucleotide-binding protein
VRVEEGLVRIRSLLSSGRVQEAGRLAVSLSLSGQPLAIRRQAALREALDHAPGSVYPLLSQLLDELPDERQDDPRRVFIVHGWDTELKFDVKNYFQNTLGANPVILHEQGGDGATLIDKFERYAEECGLAVILLSEADEPAEKLVSPGDERRPRPNVLFEMGYFFSRLGREGVILLKRGEVELNSDVLGIEWIDVSRGVAAAGEEIRLRIPWLRS